MSFRPHAALVVASSLPGIKHVTNAPSPVPSMTAMPPSGIAGGRGGDGGDNGDSCKGLVAGGGGAGGGHDGGVDGKALGGDGGGGKGDGHGRLEYTG